MIEDYKLCFNLHPEDFNVASFCYVHPGSREAKKVDFKAILLSDLLFPVP
jgi:hypothetical protein